MRVLRVAQACYPDVTGGGAYHVHAMSRDQAARGHDVTVLTIRRDPGLPHVEERAGYTVVRFDRTVAALGNEFAAGAARYLNEADGFDVVHAHSHLYLSTNLAALQRRLGDVPLAITNHGLYSQTAPPALFAAYLRTLGRWTLDQADLVFCYTDVDERRLRELGVETDVAVVANGIDTERFTPDGPTSDLLGERDVDGDGPAILFVGRLVEGKRPGDAVAALRRLRETHPTATLYVCGDGPLRDELEPEVGASVESAPAGESTAAATTEESDAATAAGESDAATVADEFAGATAADGGTDAAGIDPGSDPRDSAGSTGWTKATDRTNATLASGRTSGGSGAPVVLLGQVPYDEMPAVYRSADALVLPSRAEGVPRTVLEAMASGTPVVTSDLPHVREIAAAGGTTAPVGDVEAFAGALRSVVESPPAGGPAYVREHHRWADTVDATTEALELLGRSRLT